MPRRVYNVPLFSNTRNVWFHESLNDRLCLNLLLILQTSNGLKLYQAICLGVEWNLDKSWTEIGAATNWASKADKAEGEAPETSQTTSRMRNFFRNYLENVSLTLEFFLLYLLKEKCASISLIQNSWMTKLICYWEVCSCVCG